MNNQKKKKCNFKPWDRTAVVTVPSGCSRGNTLYYLWECLPRSECFCITTVDFAKFWKTSAKGNLFSARYEKKMCGFCLLNP